MFPFICNHRELKRLNRLIYHYNAYTDQVFYDQWSGEKWYLWLLGPSPCSGQQLLRSMVNSRQANERSLLSMVLGMSLPHWSWHFQILRVQGRDVPRVQRLLAYVKVQTLIWSAYFLAGWFQRLYSMKIGRNCFANRNPRSHLTLAS